MKKLFSSVLLLGLLLLPLSCRPATPDSGDGNKTEQPDNPETPGTPDTPDTPEDPGDRPDVPQTKAARIRLMSFNILQAASETEGYEWATVRKAACLKMFRDIDPDLVCVQEARKTQCSDLSTSLPAYMQVKHPKDNIESNGGQRDLIMYKPAKFKLLGWDKYWFSEDGTASGERFGDSATTQKLTIFARFRHLASGKEFLVYDTHFFAKCNLDTSRPHCVRMSLESIRKEAGEDGIVFFCGDLNMAPDNPVLAPMFEYMGHAASDAPVSDGVGTVTYNGFRTTNQKVLDHIFYRNASPLTYKVVNDQSAYGVNWISDHYPIYTDIEF